MVLDGSDFSAALLSISASQYTDCQLVLFLYKRRKVRSDLLSWPKLILEHLGTSSFGCAGFAVAT